MSVFANTFSFNFKQARICNDLVILFLRQAVSRPHTQKPLSTYAWLVAQQECLEPPTYRPTWTTDCHQNLRSCQFPSPCSVTSYGQISWFPCSHSIFFRFFTWFSRVSDCLRFRFYTVFQNVFEYLYTGSFSIVCFCFSFSISYSNTITFGFSISFSYSH